MRARQYIIVAALLVWTFIMGFLIGASAVYQRSTGPADWRVETKILRG